MVKDPRLRLVSAPYNISGYNLNIRFADAPPSNGPKLSVVICTLLDRECITDTLRSLEKQSFKDFEVVIVDDKESLAFARDKGLRKSVGEIVSLIDDDVVCSKDWAKSIAFLFDTKFNMVGLSGPTEIPDDYKQNRDLFKYRTIKKIYDWFFLDKVSGYPGRISRCGAPSTASNDGNCRYKGAVDYLECCNMSVRRQQAIEVGGFSTAYIKTSEWAEVDLSIKLGKVGSLYFHPDVSLKHLPSNTGVYANRLSTGHRWANFLWFQSCHVKLSLRTFLYRAFIWTYLQIKQHRIV